MSERDFTLDELKAMPLDEAVAELNNRVYVAACFIEWLENAGKVSGNGHHAAQKIAAFAVEVLRARWL